LAAAAPAAVNGNAAFSASSQIPTALISSPSGTYFNEGENIVFSGSGTDDQDGQLNGDALVWTSNIDGDIGTGPTLVTSVLSADDHEISLSVTDSDGNTHTSAPLLIHVEQTRFIKMGPLTAGVPDASNAFDGDLDTAATITTTDTEFIHFRAYIGGADKFIFKIKHSGATTPGSKLAIDGLDSDGRWQPVIDVDLQTERVVTVKVSDSQDYKDGEDYINLRAKWINGLIPDNVHIYEFWRVDPLYAAQQTTGINDSELAFDEDLSSYATFSNPWASGSSGPFLHFSIYVGWSIPGSLNFNLYHNNLGSDQFLVIDIENLTNPAPGDWVFVQSLTMNTRRARLVSIPNVQDYMDKDGYISLRARWANLSPNQPLNNARVYEIRRIDPFFVGSKSSFTWVKNTDNAVDGDMDSYARIDYFWGEQDHEDFLHLQSYLGDLNSVTFSIKTDPSAPGSILHIEGERGEDDWSLLESIDLNESRTTKIELPNTRAYVNSDGYLSIRTRWEADSPNHDAYVNEVWRETD
jgi:hypothetical protein